MSKQHKIVKQCASALHDAIYDELSDWNDASSTTATVETGDGWIEISTNRIDEVEVCIFHGNADNERECSTLAKAIKDALPCWDEVQREWEEENQYEDNGGLDPAFSSWEEVNGMFYTL